MFDNEDNDKEMSVFDRAAEEGEEVFRHYWDANRPGGSGSERVYLHDGKFYYVSEDYESAGPYATLEETLDANEPLIQVTGCTVSIESTLIGDDAIVNCLVFPTNEEEYEASVEEMTIGLGRDDDPLSEDARSLLGDEDDYLVDGKQFRINQTHYEFRAPATLIPMGQVQDNF